MQKFGCDLTEIQNRISRHQVTVEGNFEENNRLAQLSNSIAKKTPLERCQSFTCIITEFVADVLWFQCDQCDEWCHGLCEGLTPMKEKQLGNSSQSFICNHCRKDIQQQIPKIMETKATAMLEEENRCRETLLALEKEKNELLEANNKRCGEFQEKLKSALANIGVQRGQYHGGSFN